MRASLGQPSIGSTLVAFVLVISLAFTSFLTGSSLVSFSPFPWSPDAWNHPNVQLRCGTGLSLANHHCVSSCPNGFSPVKFDLGLAPICMSPENRPVSVYDLAGLPVSSNNGISVYLVVSNVPLTKVAISSADYGTIVWLQVSYVTLDTIVTAGKIPDVRTEIATVGDFVAGTFLILTIGSTSVQGNITNPYPLCCFFHPKTIQIGDDIGIHCAGQSEIVEGIDFRDQVVRFRATQTTRTTAGCPICLSGDTVIDTPVGQVNVKTVEVGTLVWTLDRSGNRVVGTTLEVRRALVPPLDMIVHVVLWDGRQLYASIGHPTTDGRTIGQLKTGDSLDHSIVKTAELVLYGQAYTYDLLPSGGTGFYWANGILLGSTIPLSDG